MYINETLNKNIESNKKEIQKLEEKILEIKKNSENITIVTTSYLMVKHNLEIALNKIGLTVLEDINILTGSYIGLRFVSLNDKFKFVSFDGYTKLGAGRNHNRLVAKSEKISKIVSEVTGFNCRINIYSLESRKNNKENIIYCELIFSR